MRLCLLLASLEQCWASCTCLPSLVDRLEPVCRDLSTKQHLIAAADPTECRVSGPWDVDSIQVHGEML